jgi:hypothetical protein
MEGIVFLIFSGAIGYVLFWTVKNEKVDPDGGHDGWFAIKEPDTSHKANRNGRPRP